VTRISRGGPRYRVVVRSARRSAGRDGLLLLSPGRPPACRTGRSCAATARGAGRRRALVPEGGVGYAHIDALPVIFHRGLDGRDNRLRHFVIRQAERRLFISGCAEDSGGHRAQIWELWVHRTAV
jgi:hypothetical protein